MHRLRDLRGLPGCHRTLRPFSNGERLAALCVACYRCAACCPTGARRLAGKTYSEDQLLGIVLQDKLFYDESGGGVTCSGGECLSQSAFVVPFLRRCRAAGVHTAVDTCGFVPREVIESAVLYTDLFLYDIKLMDPAAHRRHTGADNALILSNLEYLKTQGASVWIRVPLIPGITDTDANLEGIARYAADTLENAYEVWLLPYNRLAQSKYEKAPAFSDVSPRDFPLRGTVQQSREEVERMRRIMTALGARVRIINDKGDMKP